MRATEYIVIRQVTTDQLRICRVVSGYRPKPDLEYTWGGPFRSKAAATKAIEARSEALRRQLYTETAPCTP